MFLVSEDMKNGMKQIWKYLTAVSLSAQNKRPFYDKGYAGNVELGCLVKSYPYATLSTTHGYSFGKGWFVGLGGAFESGLYARDFENPGAEKYPYEGDMMVKLFLDVRKTFLMKSLGSLSISRWAVRVIWQRKSTINMSGEPFSGRPSASFSAAVSPFPPAWTGAV